MHNTTKYLDEIFESLTRGHDGKSFPEYPTMTMIGVDRLQNVRYCCETAIQEQIPGDFIECGVWRGGTCIFMRAILEAFDELSRKVYVADSFNGVTPPHPELYPADTGDGHHNMRELAIPKTEVMENFKTHKLLDDQVIFLEGWFKDTLPEAPIENLAVLRIDGDLYESYMDCLNALYHKVSKGGFVIIDDYGMGPVKQAIKDFRTMHNIIAPIIPIDESGIYWRVE